MAKPGPKRTPTAVLSLHGSWRAKTRSKREPKPTTKAPPAPEWLLPAARAEWNRLMPQLEALGLLTGLDWAALAGYVQSFAHWRAAEQWMAQHGTVLTMRNDKGEVKFVQTVPQFGIAQKALEKMLRFGALFGLTPSDRGGMNLAPTVDENPKGIEAFARKRG